MALLVSVGVGGLGVSKCVPPGQVLTPPTGRSGDSASLTCPGPPGWALCLWPLSWVFHPKHPPVPNNIRQCWHPLGTPHWPPCIVHFDMVHGISGARCPPCPHGPRRPTRSSQCRTHWHHARFGSGPSHPRLDPRSWQQSGGIGDSEERNKREEIKAGGWEY